MMVALQFIGLQGILFKAEEIAFCRRFLLDNSTVREYFGALKSVKLVNNKGTRGVTWSTEEGKVIDGIYRFRVNGESRKGRVRVHWQKSHDAMKVTRLSMRVGLAGTRVLWPESQVSSADYIFPSHVWDGIISVAIAGLCLLFYVGFKKRSKWAEFFFFFVARSEKWRAADKMGRRTKLTYPDNSCIKYEYDAMSRLTCIKNDGNDVLAQYSYDQLSRRTLVTLGNDANAVYEFDIANRLTKLANDFNDISEPNTIVFDYNDYDNVGNRLSMKVDDTDEHSYAYDKLYQLTAVNYPDDTTLMYYYDSLGNRTEVTNGGTADYSSNNLNQYTEVGDNDDFSYDLNGNLTNDGTYKYYYDYENRLTDVNDQSNNRVASYKYDFAGRRIKRTVYGETDKITEYCYDGDQIIDEYDYNDVSENYELARVFIYGQGIDEPICMVDASDVQEGSVYWYHYDGLGSVVALSNNNGILAECYEYDVFGQPTIYDANGTEISQSAVSNPYLFTGRRYDSETGLYYYRARYYSPEIGRFLQPDPIGYAAGLNLYTYCGNNPINWVDPYGLDILGIHSTESHSWISLTLDNGKTHTFGNWPSDSRAGDKNRLRPSTDVRLNFERGDEATASRYHDIDAIQRQKFLKYVTKDRRWTMTYNCSSLASDCWKKVTEENVNADDWGLWKNGYPLPPGIETPWELTESIQELEGSDPTSHLAPKSPDMQDDSSSSDSSKKGSVD